ncbi:MAG: SpoIIE family protein phosphatase [Planctomycetales bacterium]|nr:SpoIIE family protein phosphatase [Planctomycetales bacterium]
MARKLPGHLKIHVEDETQLGSDGAERDVDIDALMQAFTTATGWIPRPLGGTPHHPVVEHVLASDPEAAKLPLKRRMRLVCSDPMDGMLDIEELSFENRTSEEAAWELLEQIDELIQSANAAERTIAKQEAQLATSLSVSIRQDESEQLAGRLAESLHRAAAQTCSDAAAIYLLDDTTSELKMRSCWGLPTSALAKAPRDLRGCLGDLEALMGNAVLLENTALAPEWNCPEPFAAAMCLPIGSPLMPHGTLWLWSEHVRDFTAIDIDVAKAAADKILVDIERTVLADEVLKNRGIERQLDAAGLIQSSRLPSNQPLHQDYEIGGWTFQGASLGGNFHSWHYNRFHQICATMGSANTTGVSGGLVAISMQTVVETCWNSRHKPAQVLRRANDVLWETQDGDWSSSLAYLQVHPESGSVQFCMAGDIQAFQISHYGFRPLNGTQTRLAVQPDTTFRDEHLVLDGGDMLLIASSAVVSGRMNGGFSQEELLQVVRSMSDDPVQEIADHLARLLPLSVPPIADSDRSLLLLRRRF